MEEMQKRRSVRRQAEVPADIRVVGVDDWRSCLAEEIDLEEPWADLCGSRRVPYLVYAMVEAEVNDVSFERVVVSQLLGRGYVIEELVVEFTNDDEAPWGKCTWYKEHPSYPDSFPPDDMFAQMPVVPNLMYAMFATEHAGNQKREFYSLQMVMSTHPLANKTIVFHKVVFTPPRTATMDQAAAG